MRCGREIAPSLDCFTCDHHAGSDGILDVLYDYEAVARSDLLGRLRRASTADPLRRYSELLPLPHGWDHHSPEWLSRTPLHDSPSLAKELGVSRVWVKDEGRNPTGSLKDRPSTLAALLAQGRARDMLLAAQQGTLRPPWLAFVLLWVSLHTFSCRRPYLPPSWHSCWPLEQKWPS